MSEECQPLNCECQPSPFETPFIEIPSCGNLEVLSEVSPEVGEENTIYFDSGADFPAGRYAVAYKEGAMSIDGGGEWRVNGEDGFGYHIVYDDGDTEVDYGGTETGFPTEIEASYANVNVQAVVAHTGGKIGVRFNADGYGSNVNGDPPVTFTLQRLCL